MRAFLSGLWNRLNPVEPSGWYLLWFMVATLALFALAAWIGQG